MFLLKYVIRQATKAYKTVNAARNCAQALIQLDQWYRPKTGLSKILGVEAII